MEEAEDEDDEVGGNSASCGLATVASVEDVNRHVAVKSDWKNCIDCFFILLTCEVDDARTTSSSSGGVQ